MIQDNLEINAGKGNSTPAACPLCAIGGVAEWAPRERLTQGLHETRLSLMGCSVCGLRFLHPLPDEREKGKIYSQDYYGEENVRFLPGLEALSIALRLNRVPLKELFSSPGRVLDIGCGRGEMLQGMKKLGWQVKGMELSELSARRARALLGDDILVGRPEATGFASDSFDLVVLWHVIEHLDDPAGTVNEIHRILKPGGYFVLSTPNWDSWNMKFFREKCFGLGIPQNSWYFTPATIRRILRDRFEVIRESQISWEYDPFSHLQSCLNFLGRNDNFFYSALHRAGKPLRRTLRFAGEIVLAGALLAPAVLLAAVSAAVGKGFTLTMLMRKKES